MTRRFISFLVLSILIAAQSAPLAAGGRHCRMDPPAKAARCTLCDLAAPPAQETSVSAGSCCRFEAASPRSATPGVVPAQGAQELATASVSMFAATPSGDLQNSVRSAFAHPSPPRSTDSPITLSNTLRL